MRKLLLTTAAVAAAIGLAGCGKKEPVPETPNTFTDTRDGQTYKTVKIGKQTWMAQNLNYKTDSSWCYNDSLSYCQKYGRLYSWNAAKMACPTGYHLPSLGEWDSLAQSVGGGQWKDYWVGAGMMLKAKSGWKEYSGNESDDFGFSALPSGEYSDGNFYDADDDGFWWTATEHGNDDAYGRCIYYVHASDDLSLCKETKSTGYSVRCVADRP